MVRMSETKDQFWKKVTERIKENMPEEIVKNLEKTGLKGKKMSILKEVLQNAMQATIEELRVIEKESFLGWMKLEQEEYQTKLENAGYWYLEYLSHLRISGRELAAITEFGLLLASFELDDEIIWEHDLASKLLMLTLVNAGNSLLPWLRFRPFHDFESFTKQHLNLDINWMKASLALITEELLVKKTLRELGVPIKEKEDFQKVRKKLVTKLEEEGLDSSLKILTIPARRTIRNKVIHEGYNPSENDAHDLMGDVMKLAKNLSEILKECNKSV